MQPCVLSDRDHGPAVRWPVHAPTVGTFEPQPLVSRAMAINNLGACVIPDARISCSCSFNRHLIFGVSQVSHPPPNRDTLLGMYMIIKPCGLTSQGHNPFLTLTWVNKPVFCLGCPRNLVFCENLECRTMPLCFLSKTDHHPSFYLVVRMPVIPCLLSFNTFCVKVH